MEDSQVRRTGGQGKFVLDSEDWTDNDFNDLIVKVERADAVEQTHTSSTTRATYNASKH